MKIPRNFDRWMFDYKEGNLSQSEMSYFEKHMSDNPQLSQDIEAWDNSYVSKEATTYPAMASLQKERAFHFGWVATISLLVISSIASILFINSDTSNLYSLRNSKIELFGNNFSVADNLSLNTSNQSTTSNISLIDKNINNSQNNFESIGNEINPLSTNTSFQASQFLSNQNDINLNVNSVTNEFNPEVGIQILNEELEKIDNNEKSSYTASYKNNPSYVANKTSRNFKKSKSNYGSLGYKIKKALKKIEKISGYPVGLTNLKDPDLLIPNSNLLDFNSGFVGGYGSERFESRYRNQWLGESNNLQSLQLNFDTYSKSLRGGFGIALNSDNFNNGAFTDNRVSFFYSPKFAITSKVYFEPAIKMTLGLMTLNSSKMTPNTDFEIGRGRIISSFPANDLTIANNLWYKDYGVGFIINADKFFIGVNANNISQHNQSVYGQNKLAPIEYSAIVGMDYQSRNKKMTLSPFVSYYNNTTLNELWGGLNIKYQSMTIGGAYSSNNEYSASLGMKFKTFKLIYQYDMTKSYLSDEKFGSHTIGIRINTKRKKIR